MKIYLVSSGEYSDYSIDCAYAIKELADKHVAIYHRIGRTDVDVLELEVREELHPDDEERLRQMPYWTFMFMGDEIWNSWITGAFNIPGVKVEYSHSTMPSLKNLTVTYIQQPDRESAIKVALEHRAKFLAEKHGI